MNELSKDVKTHIILTFAGTKHHITSEQNDRLKMVGEKDFFEVDGSMLKMSTVSAIMPIEEYYLSKPDERPAPKLREFKDTPIEYVPIDRQAARSERALRGLLSGLAHFTEHHGGNSYLTEQFEKHKATYKKDYGKDFVYTNDDRDRVLDSFNEKDVFGLPRIPCEKCLGPYIGRKKSNASVSTIAQFS